MKMQDIYDDPNKELTEEEIDFLKRKRYNFNYNTTMNICKNYELFCGSLCNKFDSTIDSILRHDFRDEVLFPMNEKISEVILDCLMDRGFVFNKKNVILMQYNPLFLIASLENDYYETINLVDKSSKKCFIVPNFSRENKILKDILIKNDFLLDKSNFMLVNSCPSFLLASLSNYCDSTLNILNLMETNLSNISDEEIVELIEILFVDNDKSFCDLPVVVKNVITKYIKENCCGCFGNDLIYNLIMMEKIPLTYLDADVLSANAELLYSPLMDKAVGDFLYFRMDKYNFYNFSEKDEEILLQFLKEKYNKCHSVEDVIRKMNSLKLTRDDMSILEMFAIQVYGAKLLYKAGNKGYINVFGFKYDFGNFGFLDKDCVNISINGRCNTVFDIINTLYHEIEHVMQRDKVNKILVHKDNDVMIYYKDEILHKILGNTYYEDNYEVILFEYDADIKSYIKTFKFFAKDKRIPVSVIDDKFKRIMSRYLKKTQHSVSTSRNVKGVILELNDLFEREMNKLMVENKDQYLFYIDKYPIIRYEFKCDEKFRRKTIEEIIDDFVRCDKREDKGIYFNLVKLRINVDREDSESIEENIETLERLYYSNKYDEKVKQVILKLIDEYCYSDDERKYKGCFYRINASR